MPTPLHVPALVCIPAEHEPGMQSEPEGQFRHAPALHLPSVPHVDAAVATQTLLGSVVPLVAAAHVPLTPPVSAAEHAWQAVLHAVLQQNPSAQKPLVHSLAAAHARPFGFVPQEPATQNSPGAHAALVVQVVKHALGPHT
jgi:hypothetical protein